MITPPYLYLNCIRPICIGQSFFRIIIILVFIIVRYIPNYTILILKITQYDTNNNYYVRMYIDKKKTSTHRYGSPLYSIPYSHDILSYKEYHILLYIAFKSSF